MDRRLFQRAVHSPHRGRKPVEAGRQVGDRPATVEADLHGLDREGASRVPMERPFGMKRPGQHEEGEAEDRSNQQPAPAIGPGLLKVGPRFLHPCEAGPEKDGDVCEGGACRLGPRREVPDSPGRHVLALVEKAVSAGRPFATWYGAVAARRLVEHEPKREPSGRDRRARHPCGPEIVRKAIESRSRLSQQVRRVEDVALLRKVLGEQQDGLRGLVVGGPTLPERRHGVRPSRTRLGPPSHGASPHPPRNASSPRGFGTRHPRTSLLR